MCEWATTQTVHVCTVEHHVKSSGTPRILAPRKPSLLARSALQYMVGLGFFLSLLTSSYDAMNMFFHGKFCTLKYQN